MQKSWLRKWKRAAKHLVTTGWNGTGKRISIKDTCNIDAILSGDIKTALQRLFRTSTWSSDRTAGRRQRNSGSSRYFTQMQLSGKRKRKTWLTDSSRTSLNTWQEGNEAGASGGSWSSEIIKKYKVFKR